MRAHVICCNDSVEHVVLEKDIDNLAEAEALADHMAKEHYARSGKFNMQGKPQTEREYRRRMYWHVHTVNATWTP